MKKNIKQQTKKTFKTSLSFNRSKRSWIIPICGLLAGFLAAFLYVSFIRKSPAPPTVSDVLSSPTSTPIPTPISLVLLGYGGPTHDGGYLTDSIIQIVIDPQERRVLMIHVPRDIAVKIPVSDTEIRENKINAAFAIGIDDVRYPNKPKEFQASTNPGALVKKLISEITGIPVSHFIAVSFDGFVKAIDTLGGIEVVFDQPFSDERYPIRGKETDLCGKTEEEVAFLSSTLKGDALEQQFSCRYEHLYIPQGRQRLDGELALKVARSRHSTSDFDRSRRQRLILDAVKEKVFQIGFLPKAIPFFVSLGKDVKTDMDLELIAALLRSANEMRSYTLVPIELSDENVLTSGYNAIGQFVLQSRQGNDWSFIHEFIQLESTKSAAIEKQE